ncbi:MAG TPA: nucleotide sugar dehydrogenase [Acidimicrobiales bacterium]|nr:nucleotide sugar dehydrogenase [Acidimicrobiales bacterium]
MAPRPGQPVGDVSMAERRRVAVLGQGYVGLPLAMRAVAAGHDVVGFDRDVARVKALAEGESFVSDVPSAVLGEALASGRYRVTTEEEDLDGFDVAIIDVPTPLREGVPDLSHVEDAARVVAAHVRPGSTVVLESTTYPGTTEELVAPLIEAGSGLVPGHDFHLGYSPERIDPGNAEWNLVNTPKVVSGVNEASLAAVQGFFDTIVERTVPVSTPREAELTKLLENTFRHVNVALMNELAVYANALDIDVWEAIDAAATKPFGFLSFKPGPGVGGHCLPIDPSYLSWRVRRSLGQTFRFVELANDVNDHMPEYVVKRLTEGLNRSSKPLNGSRILVLGLAYKRNTGDSRESPGRVIVELLRRSGADVSVADPHVADLGTLAHTLDDGLPAQLVDPSPEIVAAADAVVLVTDHDAFDLEGIVCDARYLLDTRGRVDGPNVERL